MVARQHDYVIIFELDKNYELLLVQEEFSGKETHMNKELVCFSQMLLKYLLIFSNIFSSGLNAKTEDSEYELIIRWVTTWRLR